MNTFLTQQWGLSVPLINAPMTPAAGGALAAAVSAAGGLGMIGVSHLDSVKEIRDEVALFGLSRPEGKFGLGFHHWALTMRPDHLNAALETQPFLVSISFGDPAPFVRWFHEAGIQVATQIQDVDGALVAEDAGVDLIVAQGTEAGGHTGEVGTLPLLQLVLDRVKTPVIAAGGIFSARGFAAALAAGAEGVWVGTPFLLAEEARVTNGARRAIVDAKETETILTSAFDRVQHLPWPEKFKGRTLRNEFTDRWHGREDEACTDSDAEKLLQKAKAEQNYDIAHVYAGQSVGGLTRLTTASEIVDSIAVRGERWMRERVGKL